MIEVKQPLGTELKLCPRSVSLSNVTRPCERRFEIAPILDKTLCDDFALDTIVIDDTETIGETTAVLRDLAISSKRSSSTSPSGKQPAKKQKPTSSKSGEKKKSNEKKKSSKKSRVDLEDDEALECKIEDMFLAIYASPETTLRSFMLRQFRFSLASQARLQAKNIAIDAFNLDLRNPELLTHIVLGKDESDRIACLESDCRRMLSTVAKWEREYSHFTAEAAFALNALGMVRSKALELQSVGHTNANGTMISVHEHARQTLKDLCKQNGLHRYKNKFYAWRAHAKRDE